MKSRHCGIILSGLSWKMAVKQVLLLLLLQAMDSVEAVMDTEELRQRLGEHGQDHLLRFWDMLNNAERHQLTSELSALDVAYVNRCYEACASELKQSSENIDDHLEPLPESVIGSVVRTDPDTLKRYEHEGQTAFCASVLCSV